MSQRKADPLDRLRSLDEEIARHLQEALDACAEPVERDAIQRKLSELEQRIALRLEALRINSRL
jgi:hypothetical protein